MARDDAAAPVVVDRDAGAVPFERIAEVGREAVKPAPGRIMTFGVPGCERFQHGSLARDVQVVRSRLEARIDHWLGGTREWTRAVHQHGHVLQGRGQSVGIVQRNIVLVGGTRTGKIHLAVAVARSCIRIFPIGMVAGVTANPFRS